MTEMDGRRTHGRTNRRKNNVALAHPNHEESDDVASLVDFRPVVQKEIV